MASAASMQLGMVGLGRMGGNIVRRLMRAGHECVVYDVDASSVKTLEGEGAAGAQSIEEFVAKLRKPRAVWIMVPAGDITAKTIESVAAHMEPGDIIIDGGNSYYRDDIRRSKELAAWGIHLVDCGTSGGIWGLRRGYCLMLGGEEETVAHLEPIFASLAPGVEAAVRTPGRTGEAEPCEKGYFYCGRNGAGHFVKMIHNGIEYGMMAAIAEGLNVLRNADAGTKVIAADAETAQMVDPDFYRYDLDIAAIAELWRRGSVVGSWLLDLTAIALHESPDLAAYSAHVSDSGEGRWTSIAAIDEGVPAPVLTTALYSRFASRRLDDFADRALSAMRKQFGGHVERD
jgi:6-phosphogluconate dehydrogenase